MRLKYLQTIHNPQAYESKIVALCWAPNNEKLAVATADRQILLFDHKGTKRDRFSTKPADAELGKKSYIITAMEFNNDSTKLAVAQSDSIVFVYKIGATWDEKKAICNKFLQPSAVTCVIWLNCGPIICGLFDGKVRALYPKSNKSKSLYASDSLVISLCANSKGTGFISGHLNGNVVRFLVSNSDEDGTLEEDLGQGRVFVHPVPPFALAWAQNHIFVGGYDKRVYIYSNRGKVVKKFDYNYGNGGLDKNYDMTLAACNPSGHAVVFGGFDCLKLYEFNLSKQIWEEATNKVIKNFYTVTALAWKSDGSELCCGGLCGTVLTFESVTKRMNWKNIFQIIYVGLNQVVIKFIEKESSSVTLKSSHEIYDVKVMGRDRYAVARTKVTILIADLFGNKLSEIRWNDSGFKEKFYFEPQVCYIFNAGELTIVEYGVHNILCSVRTEIANPHLLSVSLQEKASAFAQKIMAYLLDLKTISIMNLNSKLEVLQITHDSKIDWLELSEVSCKLLFRDQKHRLMLADIISQVKQCIFTDVGFAKWVDGSDVIVAQSKQQLAVWYNINIPESPTISNVQGDVIDVIRQNGLTQVICADGNNTIVVNLDEGLVEFGAAINEHNYGKIVVFLESLSANAFGSEALWQNLAEIAKDKADLWLRARCAAALGDIASTYYVLEDNEPLFTCGFGRINLNESEIKLALLDGNLNAIKHIYLENGDIETALNIYKMFDKWDDAIRLAESESFEKVTELKNEYTQSLVSSRQFDAIARIYENDGQYEDAIKMYLKSKKIQFIPHLLLNNDDLLQNNIIVENVLNNLHQQELFDAAADIYKKLENYEKAMECYRKGNIWSKAVDLARSHIPLEVVRLEEEWGDYLMENKQKDAAISHYIEAGCTLKALNAAVNGKQWKKALHIIRVIDDVDSVRNYYDVIGNYFAKAGDYSIAENMYVTCGSYKKAFDMYTEAGHWEKAYHLALQHFNQNEVTDMCTKQAMHFENSGKLKEAEKLYISAGAYDMAIEMYKKSEQHDSLIRLIAQYYPDQLSTTQMGIAKQLELQHKYRAAEVYYTAADEWKTAINMYRTAGMWEEAFRVAKKSGDELSVKQLALMWARTLPIDSATKLLNKHGILDICIRYACQVYQFEFAFQLCKNSPNKTQEVHQLYAETLKDESKYAEAESQYILAGCIKDAIEMYISIKNWPNALRIAENHEPSSIAEILQLQAENCFNEADYSQFEVLLLRAQMPELIVHRYKSVNMWQDALRICSKYIPNLYPMLQMEYTNTQHFASDTDAEGIFSRVNEWILAGQYKQAVVSLLAIDSSADEQIVRRGLLKAADTCIKFLHGHDALDAVHELAPRLVHIGELEKATELYINLDMVKEAVDIYIQTENWKKALDLARNVDPGFESYVLSKQKEYLLQKGDTELLADVDMEAALNLLMEQGQWTRCIEKAKSLNHTPILHKYVILYARKLLNDRMVEETLQLLASYGIPVSPIHLKLYHAIITAALSIPESVLSQPYDTWKNLRQILYELCMGLDKSPLFSLDDKLYLKNVMLVAHYYALRAACRQVSSLKPISTKISISLLRYTDIIPADRAFYEAGMDARDDDRSSDAFVFFNHYLDICEAIEDEDDDQEVDHSDLIQTDFPTNIVISSKIHLDENPVEHASIRDWVLTTGVDQSVNQELPLDSRQLYESCLEPGQLPCIVCGYPIKGDAITFSDSQFQANKDAWTKVCMAAKIAPTSNISNAKEFIIKWCGATI